MLSGGIVVWGTVVRYIDRKPGEYFPLELFEFTKCVAIPGESIPLAFTGNTMNDDRAWHHAVLTTYGAWLPGDKRGFRTLHHREHVEGDYHNPPPPGIYEGLAKHSRDAMSQAPVVLPPNLRSVVGNELRDRLTLLNCWVLCCAVAKQHVHLLVKLRADDARSHLGLAKKHVTCALRRQGWTGNVWAAKGKVDRICSREHQVAAYRYILRHEQEGAWIGVWRSDPAGRT